MLNGVEMTNEEEQPMRECLSLAEYVAICKDYLLDCFDEKGHLIRRNDLLNIECNIRAALEVLDDIDNAEWVDTSETDEE